MIYGIRGKEEERQGEGEKREEREEGRQKEREERGMKREAGRGRERGGEDSRVRERPVWRYAPGPISDPGVNQLAIRSQSGGRKKGVCG